jgi:DNA-binding transcriptional regulator YdaS (Cro superfamily)
MDTSGVSNRSYPKLFRLVEVTPEELEQMKVDPDYIEEATVSGQHVDHGVDHDHNHGANHDHDHPHEHTHTHPV